MTWRPRWWVALVSVLQVALGAVGFVHELIYVTHERPLILLASLALIGLVPLTLVLERWRNG